ncbi:MAG: right-handed parallel beta-helix repeat-containing protein [Propionibacteriaceae bacterium]|nr:right-handed parallel beta-helix repeat-containing protein [Propionibacteriaceae bacterium]
MTAHAVPGTTFHVSNEGRDDSPGTSQEAPWATIPRVQQAIESGEVRRGDAVLFHAGHRFFGQFSDLEALQGQGRIVFGAYGVGERPQIVGYKVLDKAQAWTRVGEGLWRLQLDDPGSHEGNHSTTDANVGLLRVDGELLGGRRLSLAELQQDWDWYCDLEAGTLTVRNQDNPSLEHEVLAAVDGRLFQAVDEMTIEGLDLVGCGGHGVQVRDARGVRVLGNRIQQIGGSELLTFHIPGVRYGNGVEVWINSHDVLVEGNVIHDVYDVAITLQGEQVVEPTGAEPTIRHGWSEVHVRGNRITRCSQSFEIWCRGQAIHDEAGELVRELRHDGPGAGYVNCSFTGNHCTDAGVGWGYEVRPDKDAGGVHLLSYSEELPMGLRITGNTFHDAVNAYLYRNDEQPTGLVIEGNEIRLKPNQRIQQQRPERFPEHEAWSTATGFDRESTWVAG